MAADFRSVPLRRRLLLLAAAGILPLVVMAAVALYALFAQQRSQAQRSTLEIARALATAADAELSRTVSVLEALATSPQLDRGDMTAFAERLRRVAALHPNWRGATISTPDGQQVVNTQYPRGERLRLVAEQASFAEVLKSRAPVIGHLFKRQSGGWSLPIRVPVIRDGEVRYVLSAPIKPEALLAIVTRQRLEPGWVITAVDANGSRVLRWPRQEEYVGTPVSGTLAVMMAAGDREGTGITTTSEGVEVYTAFSRSPTSGWVVAIGVPRTQVEATAWRSLATFGTGIALSVFMAALVLLLIDRYVRVLIAREQAARAEAEAANRAKDEFLAMLGHELRNPLGAAANAASVLDSGAPDEATRKKAIRIILRQVTHLARLTDDLLDAGRAITGKIVLRRAPMNLAAAAAQSIAGLRASGRLERHHLDDALEPVWASVDAVRLDQILSNLLVNAIKYTPPGGHIRVSVAREGADAVIRVSDDGIGLTPELARRAFDLFVQGDRNLDRSEGGLGIGLTLVRRLAELHGGSASAQSDGPDKGSVFTVRLPAIEPGDAAAPSEPASAQPRRHIVLVEDNADARETLRELLTIAGHRVEVAADGPTGLQTVLASRPEVALVDIGLPRMDGYELARRVRSEASGYRPFLVALTGYGLPEDRERALAAGFDAHLVKPVDHAVLDDVLARLA